LYHRKKALAGSIQRRRRSWQVLVTNVQLLVVLFPFPEAYLEAYMFFPELWHTLEMENSEVFVDESLQYLLNL
jgi:uncharacterized protein YbgA (DUF1722 family)